MKTACRNSGGQEWQALAQRHNGRRLQGWRSRVGFVLAVVLVWHIVTTRGMVSPLFLPEPARRSAPLSTSSSRVRHFATCRSPCLNCLSPSRLRRFSEPLMGYLVSTHIYSIRVFEPIFAGLYAIPIIIFYPLNVLFFGLGPESAIVHGALFGFFPIVLNTIQGFARVDPMLVRLREFAGRITPASGDADFVSRRRCPRC